VRATCRLGHGPTFDVLAEPLRSAGLPLLYRERIPVPLGNHRTRFATLVRDALASAPSYAHWFTRDPTRRSPDAPLRDPSDGLAVLAATLAFLAKEFGQPGVAPDSSSGR
jgi:hypothetical protein